jgi:hypothetical protein
VDPYQPPQADLADPVREAGSPFKAVFVGLLVDTGGSLLFSTLMGFVYSIYLGWRTHPAIELLLLDLLTVASILAGSKIAMRRTALVTARP